MLDQPIVRRPGNYRQKRIQLKRAKVIWIKNSSLLLFLIWSTVELKMLSTGDVQSCLRKLESLLRMIKYPGHVDYNGLSKGDPSAFLPLVGFTLTSFSEPFSEQLIAAGLELSGKTDLRFTDTFYKVLRDIFHYKPILTKQQFLQLGFSQRKISFICDVINLVLEKDKQLNKPRVRLHVSNKDGKARLAQTEADIVSRTPAAVICTKHDMPLPSNPSHAEAFPSHSVTSLSGNQVYSSSSSGDGITKLLEEEKHNDKVLYSSEMEGRLSALEEQLSSLLSGLNRLNLLEQRLEEIEKCRKTEKNDSQVITISRESWENLVSRVLLLETRLELREAQISASPPCQSCTGSNCSTSISGDSKEEKLKNRLERITNMLKSTSSLLKNPESSATPCQ